MIRFILVVIFLIWYGIFSLIALPVEWLIGKISKKAKDRSSLKIVQGAFKIVRFLSGAKTTVIGLDRIPKDESVLFVGNHQSYFDIIISYSYMPNLTGYVAKKEIEKVPLLRTWMRYLYCLFLDRNDIREGMKTIVKGIEYINNGVSIAIFPEGTTSKDGTLLPFHDGSLKFAEKSGCKIVPMVQNNTRFLWENQKPKIRKTRTVLEFCEPIDVKALSKEEKRHLGGYVKQIIEEVYARNEELV